MAIRPNSRYTEAMSYTLFISDIHLDPRERHITQAFKETLAGPARQADALYILGDLFEVWIGDDDLHPFHQEIFEALYQLPFQSILCGGIRLF